MHYDLCKLVLGSVNFAHDCSKVEVEALHETPSRVTPGYTTVVLLDRCLVWWARVRTERWLWMSLLVFVRTRVGIFLVVYLATPIIIDPSEPPRPYKRPDNTLIDVFGSGWDSSFYADIARDGYTYRNVLLPSVAFFPLLPLLVRGVSFVVGDVLVAGLLVTNTALLAATILFYHLVEREWNTAVADRAVWYMLIFPTSFFGSAIYSESLFLLCAITAFYAARREQWIIAGGAGFFAALSRPIGILVAPMLVIEWWMQRHNAPHKRARIGALCAALLVPLGLALYMLYLQWTFGDALAFVHAQTSWGRQQSLLKDVVPTRSTTGGRMGHGAASRPCSASSQGSTLRSPPCLPYSTSCSCGSDVGARPCSCF